jgi:hypothetical protein
MFKKIIRNLELYLDYAIELFLPSIAIVILTPIAVCSWLLYSALEWIASELRDFKKTDRVLYYMAITFSITLVLIYAVKSIIYGQF